MLKHLIQVALHPSAGGTTENSLSVGFEDLNICGYENYGLLGCNAV
jgi:hypothetical protein